MTGDTVADQTRRCLENLTAVCSAAGASLADAVRMTIYLTDMGAFGEVNEVYATYFEADPPARVTVGVAPGVGLPPSSFLDRVAPVLRAHSRRYGA